jgi:hypothetical protein
MKDSTRNHHLRLPVPFRPLSGPLCRGLFVRALVLLALLAAPARAQQPAPAPQPAAAQAPDLWVTVFSTGSGPDNLAVAYVKAPPKAEIEADLQELASQLGAQKAAVKITREKAITGETITTAEAKLPGLTNWSTGTVSLDPLIQTFGRFGHFRATFLFFGNFPLQAPIDVTRGPVRVETEVQGSTVNYRIWVDQARKGSAPLPSVSAQAPASDRWRPIIGVGALTLVVALGVFLIVKVILGQRRAAQAREVNP